MDLERFYEKAWAKQNTNILKEYISYAIDEINSRNFNKEDALSQIYLDRLKEEVTGVTISGKLSKQTIGKNKSQILYESRMLHDFLQWDKTSFDAQRIFDDKYVKAWNKYNETPGRIELTKEEYQNYVELVFAFKDETMGYSSDQLREYFDTVQSDKTLDMKKLTQSLAKAVKDAKNESLDKSGMRDRVYDYLYDRL